MDAGAHRHRAAESRLQPGRHRRLAQHPGEIAEHLVESRGEHAAVGQSGRSLMQLIHLELCGDPHTLPCRHPHVQAGRVPVATAVTERVMGRRGRKQHAGRGRVRMPARCGRARWRAQRFSHVVLSAVGPAGANRGRAVQPEGPTCGRSFEDTTQGWRPADARGNVWRGYMLPERLPALRDSECHARKHERETSPPGRVRGS